MKGFAGFPAARLPTTPIPDLFFSELLPAIDDLAELKVTLHCFWLLAQKKGTFRYIRRQELLSDEVLLRGLETAERPAATALQQALERAVARGTLLQATVERDGQTEEWYFLNSAGGRQIAERLQRGDWTDLPELATAESVRLQLARPNIFVLYEQNIGPLTPLIAEELREAEQSYPAEWIEEAFRIAVEQNVRRWRYARAILERWRQEGKDDKTAQRDDRQERYRYIRGEYAEFIEH
ncbi:MAG: DnaD domain protein [Anaerolineae bacterium]|nr:DnaD domain protein [Anaerolineae bacterium]